MRVLKYIFLDITLLMLNGCATVLDKTLSPPPDTQWVNVEIKNPSPYTRPFPLEVVYISNVCKKRYISGSDGSLKTDISYNPKTIPLEKEGSNDIYRARVAMTGGGTCQWKLSEFNLGIKYIEAKHLGKELVPGTAVGATIAFNDFGSRNGRFEDVYGDLTLTPKYYPFIKRYSRIKNSKKADALTLFSNKDSFANYRVYPKAKSDYVVKYYPIVDEGKVAELILPYEKSDDINYAKIIYPDGTFTLETSVSPDFEKMEEIKTPNKK